MTISSTNRKAGPFPGDGVATVLPFTFKVFAAADVLVVRAVVASGAEQTLALGTDYTVALNANQDVAPGGTVTLAVPPAVGSSTTLASQVPELQPAVFTNTGAFYPTVLNACLDRLTILVQQIGERVARSLKVAVSTPSGFNATLPTPVPYGVLGFNAAADGFAVTDPSGSSAIAEDVANALAAIRSDLSNRTDASKNAGMSGYSGALNYAAGTIGAVLSDLVVDVKAFPWLAKDDGTDARAAIQAAFNVVKAKGGTLLLPGFFTCLGSLDFTGVITKQVIIQGTSYRDTGINSKVAGKAAIDCTGSQFLHFRDMVVSGNQVNMPTCAFLFARRSTSNSAGRNHMTDVATTGFFSVAALYNYAAEEHRALNCYFTNSQPNAAVMIITRDNVAGLSSDFAVIATGNQSTTEYNFQGCAFNNYQPSGAGACVVLRGVSAISFTGMTFMVNSYGKYVDLDMTTFGANNVKFENLMFDGSASVPVGFYIHGGNDLARLYIDNLMDYGMAPVGSGGLLIKADAGTTLAFLKLTQLQTAAGIDIYQMQYSDVDVGVTPFRARYACASNSIRIQSSLLTVDRPDLFVNNALTFTDGNRTGAAKPLGSVTPLVVGELYGDTTSGVSWRAVGLTSADWAVEAYVARSRAGTPVGFLTPRFVGEVMDNTADASAWRAYGLTNTAWKQFSN